MPTTCTVCRGGARMVDSGVGIELYALQVFTSNLVIASDSIISHGVTGGTAVHHCVPTPTV